MKTTTRKITIPLLATLLLIGLLSLVAGCARSPVASFVADKYVTAIGTSVQFSDKSANEATSWLWEFGDGDNSREQNPAHIYLKKGDFPVTLTVSNKAGDGTTRANITVLQTPVADFTTKNAALVAEKMQFTDTSSGDVNSYSWNFGDGATAQERNPSHSYSATGNYTVSLKVSNQVSNDIKTAQVKIVTPVIADFAASKNTVQAGSAIEFANKSAGYITSYSWNFGDGQTATEQNPSHSYTNAGSYTVSLKVNNPASNDSKTMQVKIITPVKADFSASTATTQAGTTVQFADKSTGDVAAYSWDFGDGAKSTERNPKHAYTSRGNYAVTLTVSNDISVDIVTGKVQIAVSNLSLDLVMCSNMGNSASYTPKPDAIYYQKEPVSIYLEVKGFQQNRTTEGYDIWVQLHSLKIIRPDGSFLVNLTDPLVNQKTTGSASQFVYFWYSLGSASTNDLTGEYTVECTVLDLLSGDSKTASTTFTIKK
jgi:PKD repeat protein